MVDFSLSDWPRRISGYSKLNVQRKSRRPRVARIEGFEDRSLLTANLPVAVADSFNVNSDRDPGGCHDQ